MSNTNVTNAANVTNPAAVVAGAVVTWLGTFKCCALPALLSLLGLAGTTATLVARWLTPGLALLSAALLARSFYSLYVQRRGTHASRITTWTSAALIVLFWSLRLTGVSPVKSDAMLRFASSPRPCCQKGLDYEIKNCPQRCMPRALPESGLAALALLLLALAAPSGADPGNDNRAPELVGDCQRLQVEAGNKVAFHVYAQGVQIYRWNGTAWIFVAPEAVLYADAGDNGAVGIHYAGPTWESASGSKVVGSVLERCTPDPDAIPWLLLRAVASEGPGIFHRVTFIQRVNTVGGNAPTDPGDFEGDVARVPYTAEYFFYRQHR